MHSSVVLHNSLQGHQAILGLWQQAKPWLMAERKLVAELRLYEDSKTDAMRRYYHGVTLKTIAEQVTIEGKRHGLQTWKEYFRAKYLGFKTQTHIDPMTGKKSRRRHRVSSEDLGMKAYLKLIEQVEAEAVTELGVRFPAERVDPDTGEVL
jgi:hypothetical protein